LFWRSVQQIDDGDPCGVFHEHTSTRARGATIGRHDEKSCRWVQIDDVNGPPASRGGW